MQYLQDIENRDFESARKYVSDTISYKGLGACFIIKMSLEIFRASKFTQSIHQKEIGR